MRKVLKPNTELLKGLLYVRCNPQCDIWRLQTNLVSTQCKMVTLKM